MTTYLSPGCGYGGYCLPKDLLAFYKTAADHGYQAHFLGEVALTNDRIQDFLIDIVCDDGLKEDETIGILGLSFKPGSDDVRDTPAAKLITNFLERGFSKIVAYDPMANHTFAVHYSLPIQYASSVYEVAATADRIVIATGWAVFKEEAHKLEGKPIYDFRYLL